MYKREIQHKGETIVLEFTPASEREHARNQTKKHKVIAKARNGEIYLGDKEIPVTNNLEDELMAFEEHCERVLESRLEHEAHSPEDIIESIGYTKA